MIFNRFGTKIAVTKSDNTAYKTMRFLILLLAFISFWGNSQLKTSNLSHNFGDLYDNAPTFFDFTFTNESDRPIFLLTIDKPQEVYYLYSKKLIQPDSTMVLRLKVNDKIKGRFNYQVDVYFSNSNKAMPIYLSGNVKQKSTNSLTNCPDFTKTPPAGGLAEFEITIKVIDSLTREPIRKSKVYVINNGDLLGEFYTNSDGIIHKKFPLGFYYLTAHKNDYISNYFEGYMNFQSNYIEIELQKEKTQRVEDPIDNPVLIVNNPVEEIDTIIAQAPVEKDTILRPDLSEIPEDNFDSENFVANNITFIVDVSSSMNGMGKLDLLKMSMIELTKMLRKEDRVTLIAYSGSVRILLENISGMDKDKIITQVKSLVSKGYTNGGEAIKEGYKLARKSYIPDGNNLIFMVTDGAFNKGQQDYKKLIKTNYKKLGIRFSVVGIKTTDFLTTNMRSMAMLGGGEYVRIVSVDDAKHKLLDELKRTSYRD